MKRWMVGALAVLTTLVAVAAGDVLVVTVRAQEPAAPQDIAATTSADETAEAAPVAAATEPPAGARVTDEGWFAPRVAPKRQAQPAETPVAAVIPIRSPIFNPMPDILREKVAEARRRGATMIVFDMDTPGGNSQTMDEIVQLIMEDLADLYTVAYVNREAMSAGSIIALACDEIVMHPAATFGDAMPIMIGPNGLMELPTAERTKFETAARASVRVIAEKNGYSLPLCEALITISKEVWLVRHVATRELRYVDAKGWRHLVVGAPSVGDRAAAPGPEAATARVWEYLRTVEHPDDLLTLTANEALEMGFTEHLFETMDQVREHYRIGKLIRLEDTTAHTIAVFLNSMAVSSLLITLTLILAYIEIRTPGFGAAGVLALVCLGTLIGSRYVLELASHWEILVVGVGLVMLLVEVFVTPGFGVLGISGIALMVVGLLATGIRGGNADVFSWPRTSLDGWLLADTGASLVLGCVGALVAAGLLSKLLPKSRFASPLVLPEAPTFAEAPAAEGAAIRGVRPGDQGVVESVCRPVGKVRIGTALVDAVSDGTIIETGSRVRVARCEGNRLIVERIDG